MRQIAAVLLIVALFVGCSHNNDVVSSEISRHGMAQQGDKNENPADKQVSLDIPVIMGSGNTILSNGDTVDIQLVLTDAVYDPGEPESFWSAYWTGKLSVLVTAPGNEPVSSAIDGNWSFGSKSGSEKVPYTVIMMVVT